MDVQRIIETYTLMGVPEVPARILSFDELYAVLSDNWIWATARQAMTPFPREIYRIETY